LYLCDMTSYAKLIPFLAALLLSACTASNTAKPIIGIAATHGSSSSSVPDSYVQSVRNAGGIPVIIPFSTDSVRICESLALIDGLLLPGGEDVDPARYGHAIIPECGEINAARDTFDLCLVRNAYRMGLPILGICRGEQVINVALGGTLWQDIPTELETEIVHKQTGDPAMHMIGLAPGSRIRELIGSDSLLTNSIHHQAVQRLASGLKLTATSSDGVVEAYESAVGNQVMGVQSHPEAFARYGLYPYLAIYEDLVRRASAR